MSIDPKELFSITHYEYGEAYFGSCDGMRFRVARSPLKNVHFDTPEERADGVLLATVWPEPMNFASTPETANTSHEFEFSEKGLGEAAGWLNEIKEEFATHA